MQRNRRARERAADPHAQRSLSWTISEDGASVVFRVQIPLVEGMEIGADRHTLVLHADAADLTDPGPGVDRQVSVRTSSGTRMASMTVRSVRRLACMAGLAVIGHDEDGEECAVSGRTRRVPPKLRRLLLARDRTCRFPGCEATRNLHAHHVTHWADSGPTEARNLVLLCSFHHHRVHEGGWTIHHDGTGRFRFRGPQGRVRRTVARIPATDPMAAVDRNRAEGVTVLPRKLQAEEVVGEPPDYDLCVELLERSLRRLEPPEGLTLVA